MLRRKDAIMYLRDTKCLIVVHKAKKCSGYVVRVWDARQATYSATHWNSLKQVLAAVREYIN